MVETIRYPFIQPKTHIFTRKMVFVFWKPLQRGWRDVMTWCKNAIMIAIAIAYQSNVVIVMRKYMLNHKIYLDMAKTRFYLHLYNIGNASSFFLKPLRRGWWNAMWPYFFNVCFVTLFLHYEFNKLFPPINRKGFDIFKVLHG